MNITIRFNCRYILKYITTLHTHIYYCTCYCNLIYLYTYCFLKKKIIIIEMKCCCFLSLFNFSSIDRRAPGGKQNMLLYRTEQKQRCFICLDRTNGLFCKLGIILVHLYSLTGGYC